MAVWFEKVRQLLKRCRFSLFIPGKVDEWFSQHVDSSRRTRLTHHLEVSLKPVGGRDQGVSDMTREMIPTQCDGAGTLDMESQERVGFLLNAALCKERAKAERRCGERKSKRVLVWFLSLAAWLPAQAQTPTINPNGFVNAATGRNASSIPVTARGTIVSIYGNNLAGVTLTANGFPLPRDLGGVQVMLGSIPAPLLFVSPNQINAQVPFELLDVSSVDLVVQNGNENSAALQVTLLAQDPGIFVAIKSGLPVSPANPVFAGDSITILGAGLGAVLPPVLSGEPGPSNPLAIVAITPVVKLAGRR
jgi:uncharacterized protein (TIGR03437 family)